MENLNEIIKLKIEETKAIKFLELYSGDLKGRTNPFSQFISLEAENLGVTIDDFLGGQIEKHHTAAIDGIKEELLKRLEAVRSDLANYSIIKK